MMSVIGELLFSDSSEEEEEENDEIPPLFHDKILYFQSGREIIKRMRGLARTAHTDFFLKGAFINYVIKNGVGGIYER